MASFWDYLSAIGGNESRTLGLAGSGVERIAAPVAKGVADMVTTPARQMQPNPYPAGTEEANWYADNNARQAYGWGPEMALNMIGVGGPAAMVGATPRGAVGMSGAQRYQFNDPIFKEIALRDAQRYAGQGGNKVYDTQSALDKAQGYTAPERGSPQEAISNTLNAAREGRAQAMERYKADMHPVRNKGETMDDVADAMSMQMYRSPIFGSGQRDPKMGAAIVGMNEGSGIKAYHGSPHDFDRFDLSKIGTGEGTQMEGLGLYFAQDKKVADFYHKSTVKELMARNAKEAQPMHPDQQRQMVGQIEAIIKRDGIKAIDDYAPPRGFELAWDAAVAAAKQAGGIKGKRYEVNINANINDFYDLDKKLKDQLPHVYDAVNRVGRKPEFDMGKLPDDARGAQLRPLLNNPQAIADLSRHGVPGTKYWDQMSRTVGDGTKNLVVFDDKLIDILRKYGIALPGAVAGSQMLGANQPAPMAGL